MPRMELTERQWERIEPILPRARKNARGRPRADMRKVLNAIIWVLSTDSAWRDLPKRYQPWQTPYHYYNQWRREGLLGKIVRRLNVAPGRQVRIDPGSKRVAKAHIKPAKRAGTRKRSRAKARAQR